MSEFLLLASSVLDVFTEGTSPVRLALAPLYLGTLVLCFRFLPWHRMRRVMRSAPIIALGAVLCLFILSFSLQLSVYRAHAIPESSLAVFMNADEITNTRLAHIHTGKTAIAMLTHPFASAAVPATDTGAALASFFPGWTGPISLMLLVIAIGMTILSLPRAFRGVEGKAARMAALLLYALVSFMALEKSVDGGILSDGAFLALATWGMLLWVPERYFLRAFLLASVVAAGVLAFGIYHGLYWGEGYVFDAVEKVGVLFLLILALHCARTRGIRSILSLTLITGAMLAIGLKAYSEFAPRSAYLSAAVSGYGYVAAYLSEARIGNESIGTIGRLQIYDVGSSEGTVADLIDQYRLPYWYQPVSMQNQHCRNTSLEQQADFFVLLPNEPERLSVTASRLSTLSLTYIDTDPSGWKRYQASLRMQTCVPRRWDVVREMLRELGHDRAIVYGFSQRVVPASVGNDTP